MTWLEDDEIQQRLKTDDVRALTEAIEAISFRVSCGELSQPPPLTARQLAPLARVADYSMADTITELLLHDQQPANGRRELASLIALEFSIHSMHAAAMALQVEDNAPALIEAVVTLVGEHLRTAAAARVVHVAHFLECLFDAAPDLREATERALETWPKDGVPAATIAEARR